MTGGDEGGCRHSRLLQDRQGDRRVVGTAIIEGDSCRTGWQRTVTESRNGPVKRQDVEPDLPPSQPLFKLCRIQVQVEDRITLLYDTVEDQGREKSLLTWEREDAGHLPDHRGRAFGSAADSPDRS